MPQSAKIEELRARLQADPRSRLFVQLAEELRKAGQIHDAERVLLDGIGFHPGYLSAWVTLARVQMQQANPRGAADAAMRALKLDPENIVAARLCADAYMELGEKVEAIKKYKLVLAFLPTDLEVQANVERLEREINPQKYARTIELAEAPTEDAFETFSSQGSPRFEEDLTMPRASFSLPADGPSRAPEPEREFDFSDRPTDAADAAEATGTPPTAAQTASSWQPEPEREFDFSDQETAELPASGGEAFVSLRETVQPERELEPERGDPSAAAPFNYRREPEREFDFPDEGEETLPRAAAPSFQPPTDAETDAGPSAVPEDLESAEAVQEPAAGVAEPARGSIEPLQPDHPAEFSTRALPAAASAPEASDALEEPFAAALHEQAMGRSEEQGGEAVPTAADASGEPIAVSPPETPAEIAPSAALSARLEIVPMGDERRSTASEENRETIERLEAWLTKMRNSE
jgi:tetratricopeptide (TPR) repeat protein